MRRINHGHLLQLPLGRPTGSLPKPNKPNEMVRRGASASERERHKFCAHFNGHFGRSAGRSAGRAIRSALIIR